MEVHLLTLIPNQQRVLPDEFMPMPKQVLFVINLFI